MIIMEMMSEEKSTGWRSCMAIFIALVLLFNVAMCAMHAVEVHGTIEHSRNAHVVVMKHRYWMLCLLITFFPLAVDYGLVLW